MIFWCFTDGIDDVAIDTNASLLPVPQINTKTMSKRIELMLNWFTDTMTDCETHRFFYEYNASKNELIHESSPIRDLGTAWNTSNIITSFQSISGRHNIEKSKFESLSLTIKNTIKYYLNSISYYKSDDNMKQKDCAYMESSGISEISTIAHSAFLILSILSAYNNNIINQDILENTVPYLVNGILNNQYLNNSIDSKYGAFKIDFEGNRYGYYKGIALYPAEAMLSLLSYYQYLSKKHKNITKQLEIINAIKKGFIFYSKYFYDGHITSDYIIFFSNWQSQIFTLLFQILYKNKDNNQQDIDIKNIGKYILDLQHTVLISNAFKRDLNPNGKRYDNLSSVEIACGLESLADGLRVAFILNDIKTSKQICNAIENGVIFLNKIQTISRNGGFQHGIYIKGQRIDVTGHVANAYIKVIELMKKI